MDLLEAIKGRRSIRVFKTQGVPEKTIEVLIDAARWAPSAGNVQAWEFVIIRKQAVRRKLAKAARNQALIEEAPVIIVVCADEKRSSGYGVRGKTLYCLQETAAATQNILLTAYSLGLGTCWIGAFDEAELKEVLNAPEGIRPVVMIPVGYPKEVPSQTDRRPVIQVMHYDVF